MNTSIYRASDLQLLIKVKKKKKKTCTLKDPNGACKHSHFHMYNHTSESMLMYLANSSVVAPQQSMKCWGSSENRKGTMETIGDMGKNKC